MNISKAIDNVTYVFGRDIATLSHADLLAAIKRVQDDNKTLTATGVESTYVTGAVAANNKIIADLVKALDAK